MRTTWCAVGIVCQQWGTHDVKTTPPPPTLPHTPCLRPAAKCFTSGIMKTLAPSQWHLCCTNSRGGRREGGRGGGGLLV